MTLDELDLTGVPTRAVAAARRASQPWTQAWVVVEGDDTGLLLHTGNGLTWFFAARTWTAAWHSVQDVVLVGPGQVSVSRSGGEAYRFEFRDPQDTVAFVGLADEHHGDPPPPADAPGTPAETRRTLTILLVCGLLGSFVCAAIMMTADDAAATVFMVLLLAASQVALGIGVIGWGVLLGIRASRD